MCVTIVSLRFMEVRMCRSQIGKTALMMIDTVAAAKTKGVMELSLGAGEESSALGHHFWGKGELLAVENEHVAVLDEIFLAIAALAKGQVDQTQHIIELSLAEADVMLVGLVTNPHILVLYEALQIVKVVVQVPD